MGLLLTGGKVVTTCGIHRADLLIKHNKIEMLKVESSLYPAFVSPYYKRKRDESVQVCDISSYYVLAGCIRYQEYLFRSHYTTKEYQEQLKKWIRGGFTTFADVIQWKRGLLDKDIREATLRHFNSYMDYVFKLRVFAEELKPEVVRVCGLHRINMIILVIRSARDLNCVKWDQVAPLIKSWNMGLQLELKHLHPRFTTLNQIFKQISYLSEHYRIRFIIPDRLKWMNKRYNPLINTERSLIMTYKEKSTPEHKDFFTNHIAATDNIPAPPVNSQKRLEDHYMMLSRTMARLPAKSLGIFPQKGTVSVSSDADLVFIHDPPSIEKRCIVPDAVMIKGQMAAGKLPLAKNIPAGNLKGKGERIQTKSVYAFSINPR